MSGQAKASAGAQQYRRTFVLSLELRGRPKVLDKQLLSPQASRFIAAAELVTRFPRIPSNHEVSMLYAKVDLQGEGPSWRLTVAYGDQGIYDNVLDQIPEEYLITEVPSRVVMGKMVSVGQRWSDAELLRRELLQAAGLPDFAFLDVRPLIDRNYGLFTGDYLYKTTPDNLAQIVQSNPSHLFQGGELKVWAFSKVAPVPAVSNLARTRTHVRHPRHVSHVARKMSSSRHAGVTAPAGRLTTSVHAVKSVESIGSLPVRHIAAAVVSGPTRLLWS